MKRSVVCSILLVLVFMVMGVAVAGERVNVKPNAAKKFATLPNGVRFPEGITANPDTGDIYVGTFDFSGNNKLLRFNKTGKLLAQIDFGGEPLLGLAFNPYDDKVYICNVGNLAGLGPARIQRVVADFSDGTTVEDVADIPTSADGVGAPPDRIVMNPDSSTDTIMFGNNAAAPNALAFRYSDGALFVSDSFQGAIFRIDNPDTCSPSCSVATVKHDALLATAGFPPFGANGLAFADERILFIANTGDDRVLQTDVESGSMSGDISVFTESINGADGLAYDGEGLLWVAGNQADQVVALDENGRVVAELGEFLGIKNDGSARGLSFPASLVIVKNKILVTNLALPLTGTAAEPEADVSKYTVSRIKIPGRRRRR